MISKYNLQRDNLAKKLDDWVQDQFKEFNNNLEGAKISAYDKYSKDIASINFRDENSGYLSMRITFDKKVPDFLNEDDEELWYKRVMNVAGEKYGLGAGSKLSGDSLLRVDELYFFTMGFKEDFKDKLFDLTPQKMDDIKNGLENLKNYITFYKNAINQYELLVQKHKERLDKCLKSF